MITHYILPYTKINGYYIAKCYFNTYTQCWMIIDINGIFEQNICLINNGETLINTKCYFLEPKSNNRIFINKLSCYFINLIKTSFSHKDLTELEHILGIPILGILGKNTLGEYKFIDHNLSKNVLVFSGK